jgi:hypothetical protein
MNLLADGQMIQFEVIIINIYITEQEYDQMF